MKAGYSLERALTAPLFELRKKRGPNKHRRQRKPKVIDRDPHAPLTPAETEAALTWAVRLECAMPWVKHPQPVDARDVRRLAQ
jgi:hypothetical protein